MARLKAKDINQLAADELTEKMNGMKKELFSLRLQAKLGKLEKHSSVRLLKRDIARVKTLIRQKETV